MTFSTADCNLLKEQSSTLAKKLKRNFLLPDGWFKFSVYIFQHKILGSFEKGVLSAREETGQMSINRLTFATRILASL